MELQDEDFTSVAFSQTCSSNNLAIKKSCYFAQSKVWTVTIEGTSEDYSDIRLNT